MNERRYDGAPARRTGRTVWGRGTAGRRDRSRPRPVAVERPRPFAGWLLPALLAGLALSALLASGAGAQEAQGGSEALTLERALRLAAENNPGFQAQRNDRAVADWGVREAYGNFLPTASVSGRMGYTEAGVQRIGTLDFGAQSTDYYSSSYSLSLGWTLDGNTLFGVSNARASQRATDARIDAARFDLESQVTLQYMATLRAKDGVDVAERQLERARQNDRIVGVRVEAGAAAGMEGKQAQVDLGRAEVALIRAEQLLANEKALLMERIGLDLGEVQLVSEFEVFEPRWERGELVALALAQHPSLQAFVAQEKASRAGVRQARSSYFPSVSLSTGFSGNALQALNEDFLLGREASRAEASRESCLRWQTIANGIGEPLPGIDLSGGCPSGTLSEADRQAILSGNEVFPFDFTKNPLSVSLSVSVPVFTGFSRQRQVEQAEAGAKDAMHNRRAEELRLRTAVTQAHNALVAAHRVVEIEARNRSLAEERLELAQQRYAIGARSAQQNQLGGSTFLELLDAQSSMAVAERDYLNAVYDFHLSLVQLEAATGRTLRPDGMGPDDIDPGARSDRDGDEEGIS